MYSYSRIRLIELTLRPSSILPCFCSFDGPTFHVFHPLLRWSSHIIYLYAKCIKQFPEWNVLRMDFVEITLPSLKLFMPSFKL